MLTKLKNPLRLILALVVPLLAFVACAPVSPSSTEPAATGESPAVTEPSATGPVSTPSRPDLYPPPEVVPTDGGFPVIGEVPEDLLNSIREEIATLTGLNFADFTLIRAEAVTWPDGSLGCPEPGMSYTMALVDGYWVQFMVGDTLYDYRAASTGSFIRCENTLPGLPAVDTPEG